MSTARGRSRGHTPWVRDAWVAWATHSHTLARARLAGVLSSVRIFEGRFRPPPNDVASFTSDGWLPISFQKGYVCAISSAERVRLPFRGTMFVSPKFRHFLHLTASIQSPSWPVNLALLISGSCFRQTQTHTRTRTSHQWGSPP